MLAQQSDKASPNVFEKEWYISRKLDGEIMPSLNPVNSGNPAMGIPS